MRSIALTALIIVFTDVIKIALSYCELLGNSQDQTWVVVSKVCCQFIYHHLKEMS